MGAHMKKRTLKTWKYAGKTLLRSVLATILCAFLYLSMSVIGIGLLGQEVGYRIVEQDKSGELIIVEEHYYAPGEPTVNNVKLEEGQRLDKIREISDGKALGRDIVTQLLMLFIVGVFPYSMLWELGDKDSIGVRYKGRKADPLRGLKIGTLANIPYFLLYILLLGSKMGLISSSYLPIYRLIHLPFLPYINMVVDPAIASASDAAVWQLLLVLPILLVVPAVCCVAYILGSKQISIKEHMTYAGIKKGNADTEI